MQNIPFSAPLKNCMIETATSKPQFDMAVNWSGIGTCILLGLTLCQPT